MNPLISIITITYNAEKELPATMKSVAAQTFRDFEHIIVDGASTDGTLEVARTLGGPQLQAMSAPDNGLYDAMNKGLKLAQGEYVVFLNAGDAFHASDTLQAYADAIRNAPERPDIVYGDTNIVDSSGAFLSPRHFQVPERLTFKSFGRGMLVCHQAFMVRRALAPAYDLSYRFSADYDWTVKCLKRSNPERNVNLHRVVIDYLSNGLTDRNRKRSLRERYRIMKHHYGPLHTFFLHFRLLVGHFLRKACKV